MTTKQQVIDLTNALIDLPTFDYEGYKEGVKGFLGVDKDHWNQACTSQVYGEDPDGTKDLVQRFKVQAIALGVSRNGDYGFSGQVTMDGFQDKFAATASGLVVPMYRDHVERFLSSKGSSQTIASMSSDLDFIEAYVTHVLDPDFITNSLIAFFFGKAGYTQAIAYLYERFRPSIKQVSSTKMFKHPLTLVDEPINSFSSSRFGDIDVVITVANADQRLKDKNQVQEFLTTNLPLTWSDDAWLQKPRFHDLAQSWIPSWMSDTFSTNIIHDIIHDDAKYDTFSPVTSDVSNTYVTYGDKLWQWMKSQQNNGFGDIFQVTGQENFEYVNPYSGGCFAPEAQLALVAQSIPISDLQPGMRILSQAPGQFGISSSEYVKQPTKHISRGNKVLTTRVFGFNGETPSVTAGHIFNTLSGPKAIQPATAHLENDDVVVGQLRPGDILLRLRDDHLGYDQVTIESINAAPAFSDAVHGVHFAKGDRANTYHVNGYLVRENYPELTIDSMTKRYHAMSVIEQKSFSKTISQLPSSFEKVLGRVVFDTVKAEFSILKPVATAIPTRAKTNLLANLERSKRGHPGIQSLSSIFTLTSHAICKKPGRTIDTSHRDFDKHIAELHGDAPLPQLVVHNGVVGTPTGLATHVSTSHLGLQWSRKLPGEDDMYEHGALRSVFYGFAAAGYTAIGPAAPGNDEQLSSVKPIMAVANANTYNVQCTETTFTNAADAFRANTTNADKWAPWWNLSVGISLDKTGAASVVASLPDLDRYYLAGYPDQAPTAPIYQTAPIVYSDGRITINVTTIAGMGSLVFTPLIGSWSQIKQQGTVVNPGPTFESFAIVLNLFTNAVHGYYTELKLDDTAGSIHALAVSAPSVSVAARDHLLSLSKSQTPARALYVGMGAHQPALPATQLLADKFFTADNLSISDLQTLVAPDSTQLNSLSQSYMQNASTYWRGGDEVAVFGNEQSAIKSALPSSGSLTDNLGGDDRTWLAKYQQAILMQALQRDSKYTGRFDSSKVDKLDYYFQGGQDGCLASQPQFNKITSICAGEAFLAQTEALRAYKDDSQDWANTFYNFAAQDDQLNNQAFGMLLAPNSNVTNRYCMILNALSRGCRTYDVDLWNLVRDKVVVSPSNGSIQTKELPAFMKQFIASIITQIQAGASSTLYDELKIDLPTIYETFNTQVASEIADHLFTSGFELGQCFLELMVDLKDILLIRNKASFAEMMQKWEAKIQAKFPNNASKLIKGLRATSAIIGLGMDGFGLYMSVKYFMGWGDLTESDKASAIIGFIQTVVMTARDVAALVNIMRGKDPGSFDYKINCIKWNNATGSKDVGGRAASAENENGQVEPVLDRESIEKIDNPGEISMSEKLAVKVGTSEVAEDIAKKFSCAELITSVIAIAANVASCVCMGFQIKADFDENMPPGIKALDILSEVTTGLQVISGIVEVGAMVLGVECMAIPVVGFVIAFVGIVLMFCEMFVPRPPPESPIDKYLDDHLDDFFKNLKQRPAVTLTYDVTTSVDLNKMDEVVIKITNPQGSILHFTSLSVTIPAGDEDTQLFISPSGTDKTVTPNRAPTTNLVTYALNGDQTVFQVTGSPVPNSSDSTLVARITPVGSATSAQLPPNGLILTVTGSVNAKAGKVQLKVQESADDRPTKSADGSSIAIPNRDFYNYYFVDKR